MKKKMSKLKERKSPFEIEKKIIAVLEEENSELSVYEIAKRIKSDWGTTKKYLMHLKELGSIKEIGRKGKTPQSAVLYKLQSK